MGEPEVSCSATLTEIWVTPCTAEELDVTESGEQEVAPALELGKASVTACEYVSVCVSACVSMGVCASGYANVSVSGSVNVCDVYICVCQ